MAAKKTSRSPKTSSTRQSIDRLTRKAPTKKKSPAGDPPPRRRYRVGPEKFSLKKSFPGPDARVDLHSWAIGELRRGVIAGELKSRVVLFGTLSGFIQDYTSFSEKFVERISGVSGKAGKAVKKRLAVMRKELDSKGEVGALTGKPWQTAMEVPGEMTCVMVGDPGFSQVTVRDNAILVVEISLGTGESRVTMQWVTQDPTTHEVLGSIGELLSPVPSGALAQEKKVGKLQLMHIQNGNIVLKPIGSLGKEMRRENYAPEVIEAVDRVKEDLRSEYPRGRLAILEGPPGTGKTHLIRDILTTPGCLFVMMPPSAIPSFNNPGFLYQLAALRQTRSARIVMVMEDADSVLASRMADNITAISTLLNMGDGLLTGAVDVRFLLTTNIGVREIDEALARPGRLSEKVRVGLLSAEQATSALRTLEGVPGDAPGFSSAQPLSAVYAAARGLGWKPPEAEGVDGGGVDLSDGLDIGEIASMVAHRGPHNIGARAGTPGTGYGMVEPIEMD